MEDVRRYWETGNTNCVSTTIPTFITRLRAGESITLKSREGSSASHYIGPSREATTTDSYQLDSGETMTLSFTDEFGPESYIEIWALPETANKRVCWFKLIGKNPDTRATG